MQVISLIWGIFAIFAMIVAFLPLLGALNWVLIPFAGLGVIISGISIGVASKERGMGVAGLLMCVVALFFGLFRLVIGGGLL